MHVNAALWIIFVYELFNSSTTQGSPSLSFPAEAAAVFSLFNVFNSIIPVNYHHAISKVWLGVLIIIFWCKIHAICTNIDYILLSIFTAYIYCFAPSEYDNCFTVVCHKHRLLCSKHLLTQDIHHQSDTSSVYFSSPPCSFHLILVWTLRWLLLCKTLVVSVSLLSPTSSDQYNLQQEL